MKVWMIILIVVGVLLLLLIIIGAIINAKRRREEAAQRAFEESFRRGYEFGYDHPKAGLILGGLGLLGSLLNGLADKKR